MIRVQIDVPQPGQEPGDESAIWSGWWQHTPVVGHTFQLRSTERGDEFYRIAGVDWLVYAEDDLARQDYPAPVNSCIVTATRYRP